MKTRTAILVAFVALLCLGGVALQSTAPAVAQSGEPGPAPGYVVQAGTAAGGSYHLTSPALRQAQGDAWQVSGTLAGGGYALATLYQPALRGSGCCCTYLPCIQRNW